MLPTPAPPLGREALLDATARAAHGFAAGGSYPAEAAAIAGRPFALRIPFGCLGSPAQDGSLSYSYDPDGRVLRLTARPEVWTEAEWAQALVGSENVEALEGFWLRRPWLLTEGCPAQPSAVGEGAGSPETVGLVQVFEEGGSRVLRRGDRPYQATHKVGAGEIVGAGGFRLVLEGRVADSDRPVRCRSDNADQRPTCLVSVAFDRVAFETPGGEVIEEWRG